MSEPAVELSPALGAWLALRRLDRGQVTLQYGYFFDAGRPVPGYLSAPLCRLFERGHTRMAGARVLSTESGRALYRELGQVRGLWLATERTVPFGSAAAHLLTKGNQR